MSSLRSSKLNATTVDAGKPAASKVQPIAAKQHLSSLAANVPDTDTETILGFSLKWDQPKEDSNDPSFDPVSRVKKYLKDTTPKFMKIDLTLLELELQGEATFNETVNRKLFSGENDVQRLAFMIQDLLNGLHPKYMPQTTKWSLEKDEQVVPVDAGVGPAIIRVTFPLPPREDDDEEEEEEGFTPDGSVATSIWENAKLIASNAQHEMHTSQDPAVAPAAVINTSYPTFLKEKQRYVVNFSLTGVPRGEFTACARILGANNAISPHGSGKFDTAGSQVSYQEFRGDGTLTSGNIVPGTVEYKALSDPKNAAFTNGA